MLRKNRQRTTCRNIKGQNTVEYILVFALVLGVFIVALAPGGKINSSVNDTLDLSITAIENITSSVWP